jgi:hypothetical protein
MPDKFGSSKNSNRDFSNPAHITVCAVLDQQLLSVASNCLTVVITIEHQCLLNWSRIRSSDRGI